ncbi:MAG: TrpR-related protein YerC/YecD [Clostridia bacterium]|nr:TrpR-related protein YerC/YecD [Clostridia bacterium]
MLDTTSVENNRELFEAILSLETMEECAVFFEDLLTYNELESVSQRVRAAKLLLAGKTYEQIIAETNISSATLSRVSRCVRYGKGYKTLLSRTEKLES